MSLTRRKKKISVSIVQRAQRSPKKMNRKRSMSRYMTIRISENKERLIRAAREKQLVTYKGTPIRH